jgi:hypothetical protein
MASSSATTNNSQTSFACRTCSGATPTIITLPKPVYTNGAGRDIYQLDMVVIGGENGLNS